MFYRLLVLDIDGTLLDSSHQLPEENIRALKRYQERGGMVVLSTGKLYHAISDLCRILNLQDPQIVGNGSAIVSHTGELVESMGYLTRDQIDFGRSVFQNAGLSYLFYGVQDLWYEEGRVARSDRDKLVTLGEREPEALTHDEFNRLDQVTKILSFCDDRCEEDRAKDEAARRRMEGREDLWIYRSSYQFIEIARVEVNKGLGLRRLMEMLNVDCKDVAVVGDNENDLHMFEAAGLAVAMGQAPENVKEKADVVTASNDEAGVARFLEKNCLV